MDHIPLPLGAARTEDDEVLYLVRPQHEYDGLGFESFPSRKGFTFHRREGETTARLVQIQNDEPASFEDAASIVQSWLYFGLLEDTAKALQLPFSRKDFILTKTNGIEIINSRALTSVISQFALFELDKPENKALYNTRREGLLALQANLATAQPVMTDLDGRKSRIFTDLALSPDQWQEASKILLSVYCLAELLHAVLKINHVPAMVPFHSQAWLEQRMGKTGWCQNAIAVKSESVTSPACMFFLSNLTPPYLDGHVGCTPQRCQRSNIKGSSYVRQHWHSCERDRCVDVVLEEDPKNTERDRRISSLVDLGHIPVVYAGFCDQDPIRVVPSSSVPCYVAISHVWSDGLGNTSRNSVHACQLRRIQRNVNDLFVESDRPMPFWLDTICVPKEWESRRRAILQMRDVYAQATKVLVLDKLLFSAPREASVHEKLMRITASVWATRLWTLHESILGKELYYQFSDRAATFVELWEQAQDAVAARHETPTERTVKMLLDPVLAHGLYAVRRLSYFQDISVLPEDRKLAHVQPALAQRTTSWIQDEAVCLTTLIGQQIEIRKAILDAENDKRMLVLLHNMKTVPTGILFTRRPHYEDDGFRWIPKTLLWDTLGTADAMFMKYGAAEVSTRGLLVKIPGIRFQKGFVEDLQQPNMLAFKFNDVVWNMAIANLHHKDPRPLAFYAQVDFAFITGDSLTRDTLSHEGALVTIKEAPAGITKNIEGRLYARWEATVAIAATSISITDYDFVLQKDFEVLAADQKWCIG